MKTSLGIWALGPMVTRFVPGGYQPEHGRRDHGREGAPRRRRARRPDRRLRVPLPAASSREDNLDEVRAALDGHGIYCIARGLHLDPRFGRGGLVSPDAGDARRGACELTRRGRRLRRRARRALHHLARDRGLQLPVPDALRRELGAGSSTGIGEAAEVCAGHGRQALPRAQELRARDEDPHAQHRHDAARHPQAARPGDRQRPGQHGLAAPDHERREPRRVRGAARRRGAARPPARELRLGHVRRRQHGRRDRVHGDARARARAAARGLRRATASGSASTSTRTPRTRSAAVRAQRACSGASSTASPARIDDAALREAQSRKDAVRAYELVYAALGAPSGDDASRRARRRDDRRQGARGLAEDGDGGRARRGEYGLSTPRPGWAEQDPEDWWARDAGGARRSSARDEVAGIGLSGQMHGLVALDADERVLRPAILWNDQRTARRVRGDRGARRPRAADRADRQPRADRLHRARSCCGCASTSRRSTRGSRTCCCRRTTCGCGCAASARSTSPTLRARCCSTSRARRWSDEVLDGARGRPREWLPRALESPEVSGETPRRRAGRRRRRRPGGRRARRRRRPRPAAAVGRARHLRRRLRRAAGVRAPTREARVHAFCHAVPGTWHAMGVMLSAAGSLRWLRDASRRACDVRAAGAPRPSAWEPGRGGAAPSCPTSPASARRTPTRTRAARSSGLSLRHDRGALVRAVLEGVAYGLRDSLDLLRELGVAPDGRPRLGRRRAQRAVAADRRLGARSCRWSARPSTRAPPSARRCSAASPAGSGPTPAEAVAACVRATATVEPGAGVDRGLRARRRERFRALYPALKGVRFNLGSRSDPRGHVVRGDGCGCCAGPA